MQTPNPSQNPTDALNTRISLLQRARDGRSDVAWEELLGFYNPFISMVLGSMGFRGADLDDARQQVALRLWKGLKFYQRDEDRAKFRTWFARLIRNTALNIIRTRSRRPDGPSLDDAESGQVLILSDSPEITEKVEQEWQRYVVELAMERVKKMFSGNAVAVFEKSMDGQSVESISEELNIKTNTVYILKHRVKTLLMKEIKALRADLEVSGGEEP
ncbi:MAG: sigma-70 family RNA polymerase sigma factor [Luteolibacter sp.]